MIYHIHYIDGRDDNWIATFNQKADAEFFVTEWAKVKEDKCCIIPQKKAV